MNSIEIFTFCVVVLRRVSVFQNLAVNLCAPMRFGEWGKIKRSQPSKKIFACRSEIKKKKEIKLELLLLLLEEFVKHVKFKVKNLLLIFLNRLQF